MPDLGAHLMKKHVDNFLMHGFEKMFKLINIIGSLLVWF